MSEPSAMGSIAEKLLDYINTTIQQGTNYEIATTMVRNYSKLKNMSIGDIAEMCYVSTPTISRFCRFIGFEDFKDMRSQLEADVSLSGIIPHSFHTALVQDTSSVIDDYREAIVLNITTTMSPENVAKLPDIARILHGSARVAFFSHHFLWDIGRYLQSRMVYLDRLVELYLNHDRQLECAQSLGPGDAAIICSAGGTYPIRYPAIANAITQSGCRLVAITQNVSSSYWNHAASILSCGVTNNIDTAKFGALAAVELIFLEYLKQYGSVDQGRTQAL